jgi:hypothetical protein
MKKQLAGALALLFLAGCSTSGSTIDEDTDEPTQKEDAAGEPDLVDEDVILFPDTAFDSTEANTEIVTDLTEDLSTGPLPGEPGYTCNDGEDCLSGLCIQTGGGFQCTLTCEEECPFDWECLLYTPSATDQVYICAPTFVDSCKPCLSNTDCWTNEVDAGESCVSYGGKGFFCGGACMADDDCPDDYQCVQTLDVTGQEAMQCVLTDGECNCKQWFIDQLATTDCYIENEFGTCFGQRMCKAEGLTACDALAPAPEECNGIDDDCNGETDEGTSGDECIIVNIHGTCPGTHECTAGKLTCAGTEASPEVCDGKDNNCDGKLDEGFEDTDGDGIADCMVNDKDGDGIVDGKDNCPADFNPAQKDFDLDNFGDACDADDDNDQTSDQDDCAPKDETIFPTAEETCDGKDNNCNYVVDEGYLDHDSDGFKDCIDDDDDNDGIIDELDCGQFDPAVNPDAVEICNGLDDNCNNVVDEGFNDLDDDDQADCVDSDIDGDGFPNSIDLCPTVADSGPEDLDGDGLGDNCDADADGDAIPDKVDNCLKLMNPQQSDLDADGAGDACDEDMDNDEIENDADNCPKVANTEQKDTDSDSIGDACDTDIDGDGTDNNLDCAPEDAAVHPAAQETCDGIDNNCNFLVDEGFVDSDGDLNKDCVDSDDDNDSFFDEADCAPLDNAINPDANEICDGKDNNCNDKVDEDIGQLACGKGECFHTLEMCVQGKLQICDPMEGAEPESCDGKDNDCDGMTDEDQGTTTCGKGECYHTVDNCSAGNPVQCNPDEGQSNEICDGLDNDCDGKIDEDFGTVTCGKGICQHSVMSCLGGVEQQCDPTEGAYAEVCDGLDNNCDDQIDEDLGTIICGTGECLHEQPYCENGKITVCDPFYGVAPETCDAKDNDCNGLVDDGLGSISCGKGICYQVIPLCLNGAEQQCDPMAGAEDEECNGEDDDCDDLVDEGLGSTTCGKGQCEHTVDNCHEGVPQQCDPMAGQSAEICDGVDNNCDGIVDNGFSDFDEDGDADCVDLDDDDDNDPDITDCDDSDPEVNHDQDEVCYNDKDDNCSGEEDDGCAALSCKELLALQPALTSGVYKLDIDGDGPLLSFEAYCDMQTEGGGWTLITSSGSVGDINSYQYFPRDTTLVVSSGYAQTNDGNAPAFAIGSNISSNDKLVYFELDTKFNFTEMRGSWRGYGEGNTHHDDNWNAGSWGKSGSGSNGYVMFGTPSKVIKSGGQWGGDWNNHKEKSYTFDSDVSTSHIIRWGVEDQASEEYVLFNNIEIYVR